MIDLAAALNVEQRQVVEQGDGPCLVLAGAGSGKTRTITYRVVYLLERGVKPEEILLVTFTNKAAAEMKRRVQELTGSQRPLPWSGTFHHIGYRLLRHYAPLLGYKNNFTVLDSDDSEALIKLCSKEVKPAPAAGGKRFPSAGVVLGAISFARNAQLSLTAAIEERFEHLRPWESELLAIARLYEDRKRAAQGMDFDDLLTNLLALLQNESVHKKYAAQFRYVLVDEYQDTNKIQAAIIKAFVATHKNILVVGDDAQSIYSFRAADIANILEFERQYPGAKIFKLETNYRSSQEILAVANAVIENNTAQYKKTLRTETRGVLPVLQPQLDAAGEAAFIARRIEELLKEGTPAREIAVLFRAASHSQALEVELVSRGLAYDYRGGVRFFERAHVKDVLAYLRLMNNLADTAAWLRVLTHEEGIGPVAAERIIAAVQSAADVEGIAAAPRELLKGKALLGWENFLAIWNTLVGAVPRAPLSLVKVLLEGPYRQYLQAEYVDARDRLQDLAQLAEFAKRFDSLDEFLASATLQESFRALGDDKPAPDTTEKIILSTIHQAKGLEWSVVFVINLSAGAFPSERAAREPNGLEEERRLFYVASTRAKKQLYLTYPMAGGVFGDFLGGPSVFLNEIDPGLVEDRSLLLKNSSVYDAPGEIRYISEDRPPRIKPGSFLRDLDDL